MAGILLAAGGMLLFWQRNPVQGSTVRITVDGEEYGVYSLQENREILWQEPQGYNAIVIEQGQVYMREADCPDQYCVQHAAISRTQESIVCLPHKLVVQVVNREQQTAIDGVAQ